MEFIENAGKVFGDGEEISEWIIEQKLEIKEKLGDCIKDEKVIRLAIET